MNATHYLAALLPMALLMGCNDAGPLAPPQSAAVASKGEIDPPHPPVLIEDPVMPLPPPVWDDADDRGGARNHQNAKLDPVFPMPPVIEDPVQPILPYPPNEERPDDPPVKPLPPPQDWDEDSNSVGSQDRG